MGGFDDAIAIERWDPFDSTLGAGPRAFGDLGGGSASTGVSVLGRFLGASRVVADAPGPIAIGFFLALG